MRSKVVPHGFCMKRALKKKRRFPFHVESGLCWGGFGAQDASKTAPRRAQEAPRRPKRAKTRPRRSQDAPRLPRRSQDAPKTTPGRPQDAPRRPPRSGKFGAQKRIFSGPPPNLDFGASWARFWEVLASILGGVLDGFKELKIHKIPKTLGGVGINFEMCFGWF